MVWSMSKQTEEENIYHSHPQHSSSESSQLFQSEPEFAHSLEHHEKEFAEFYQETFSYEATALESKYAEKPSLESSSPMAPLASGYKFSSAGTSGLCSRVPFPMSDIETSSALSAGLPLYSHFIDTGSASGSQYQSGIPSSHYASVPQEHHSIYSTSLSAGPGTSTPQLLSEASSFSQVQIDPSGKQFLQSSIDETTTLSTSSTAPSTPSSAASVSPSLHRQLSEESPQQYKSVGVGRPRRGRRRGYRRGSYSTRLLNKPVQGQREELEAYENRNIQEEARHAYVQIMEQPRPKALRFRYICEGRSAGSIPGVNSTPTRKTFPTIRVGNSKGPAYVVVSCVTVNEPYRPHPHNLVGKEGCEDGVCSVVIDNPMMECSFSNLGIQCVKKRDIESSLARRAGKMIDPYHTGFEHRKNLQSIDLNSIRLCFQVYLMDKRTGDRYPLQPIVSEPIYDKKATSDLIIYKISACSSCVSGGKEIILLCDKIVKEDIKVRFFEIKEGQVEWEAYGEFQSSDVHKQVAISFKTPKYKDLEVTQAVNVFLQLFRPSDKTTSETVPFQFYPINKDYEYIEDKMLHISHPANKEALTSDSPAESMQEGVSPSLSDEGEGTDISSTGAILKSVKRFKSSPSHSKRGISVKSQEHSTERVHGWPAGFRSRESLYSYSESLDTDPQSSYEQSYCPQLEGLAEPSFEEKFLITTTTCTTLPYTSATSTAISSTLSSSILLGPTATPSSSTSEAAAASGEVEARHLQYHDMDISDLSLPPEREDVKEESLSPNSESIKKLKHDIETLNKLSRF